jgi:dethiobiotin synthetase
VPLTGFFVTGTDTGVGKTHVTSVLARALVRSGSRVAAIKPAESGCIRGGDGELRAEDAETIAAAAGGWQRRDQQCLYRLSAALAPGVAAELEGLSLSLTGMTAFVREVAEEAEIALVEGAGGWLVPLAGRFMIADLAAGLGLPVVVVARGTLGTINHSLLTVQAVRARGLAVAAVVLSIRPEEDLAAAELNRTEISRHGDVPAWLLSSAGWWPELGVPPFHVER